MPDTDELREVAAGEWVAAVSAARAEGYDYFDWLGAVDQVGRDDSFAVIVRLIDVAADPLRAVRLRTELPRSAPEIETIATVFAGASWHEREAAELFGISFTGGDPRRLLLPEDFVGAPLRKDAVLAARVGVEWPGVKEPGGAPSRRRMVPPGVPDPEVWGDRPADGPAPDPSEVAESAVGGRVRRRKR
jgi:NADH-quinone oxidoreductase subunit C